MSRRLDDSPLPVISGGLFLILPLSGIGLIFPQFCGEYPLLTRFNIRSCMYLQLRHSLARNRLIFSFLFCNNGVVRTKSLFCLHNAEWLDQGLSTCFLHPLFWILPECRYHVCAMCPLHKSALNWGKYISAAVISIPGTAMVPISMPSMSSPAAVLLGTAK